MTVKIFDDLINEHGWASAKVVLTFQDGFVREIPILYNSNLAKSLTIAHIPEFIEADGVTLLMKEEISFEVDYGKGIVP